ncbi:MAG: hypothetical protein IKZ82_07415, partial [Clostridia bacterium]|nr:hypothetical protein [Clostridia bacterium]
MYLTTNHTKQKPVSVFEGKEKTNRYFKYSFGLDDSADSIRLRTAVSINDALVDNSRQQLKYMNWLRALWEVLEQEMLKVKKKQKY